MRNSELNQLYRRDNPRTDERELFATYLIRAKRILPSFPESVLEDWIYRHAEFVLREHQSLGLDHLRFQLQTWPTERIVSDVHAVDEGILETRRHVLYSDRYDRSRLETFMIEKGTWPVPILVLDPDTVPTKRAQWLRRPFHLLEGHRRAGYLRGLFDAGTANENHQLWFVSWQAKVILAGNPLGKSGP